LNKYICIHGHFYQPPRENPWTGKIEKQPSAAPFHDWNERIFQECYKPNTEAVIINETGKVLRRVNNFENINFNFGPTLLHWIKEKHPNTLSKIIEADRKSVTVHNGHGNAIAQVYNHIIMPLANRRDKITQIKWGIKDFYHHFGRMPEGMWLAETACNDATLEALIDEKISYTILDPSQARSVRKTGAGEWSDVSGGKVNPKIPYRYLSKKSGGFIDIFFYDGPLSRNLAFDDIVYDSKILLDRIDSVKDMNVNSSQLISIAVDGETFGHHKKFTERTIAFLLDEYAVTRGYKIVNYGEYLSFNKPEYEVLPDNGLRGEGTSWSCIHGVGRWKRNCGCITGGNPGWNQRWRRHLRDSLNLLNAKLGIYFEIVGKNYFRNAWDARNDYIDLILDGSDSAIKIFFGKHASGKIIKKNTETALQLLEMQKFSQLMFTSCGWFFSDISGIESRIVLEYAKRAVEIAENLSGLDFTTELLEGLEKAKSNIPESGNGKIIYNGLGK
jgi:alpha-amylase/alpha-mannosidase (GH57 family)